MRVYETRDRGATWGALGDGLPQSEAYLTVLRQAFCSDGGKPLALYFGATSGEVFGSADGGRTWRGGQRTGAGLRTPWPPRSRPSPMIRRGKGWRVPVVLVIVAAFVIIEAFGLCSTFGQLVPA